MKKPPPVPPPDLGRAYGGRTTTGPAADENQASDRPVETGRTAVEDTTPGMHLLGEQMMPLTQVPKLGVIPERRRGTKLSLRTVYRWALTGANGVRLETILVGGQRFLMPRLLGRLLENKPIVVNES